MLSTAQNDFCSLFYTPFQLIKLYKKNKMKKSMLAFAVAVLMLASCVSSKKYKTATAQVDNLNGQLSTLNTRVAECDKQVAQLKTENIQYGNEAADCRKAKAALAQRVDNFNKALEEQGTSMQKVQETIEKDFKPFEEMGATVTYNNGLVHINFPDKFFFKSGSSTVGVHGRESLNIVAQVLRDFKRVTCIIVGNTDTVHVKGIADNWSLSTERANAVVRILYDTYNINPKRLTSAGKGKYNPVASNDTPEGREKNRRIEIIFNPDLDRLWELSESK
jgi:chemotaxis protein MotB